MYQEERLRKIQQLLKKNDALSAKEMMDYFQVSRDTIRRDFSLLEAEGKALRTHGGIIPNTQENEVSPLNKRIDEFGTEKIKIAENAAKFIKPGKTYFLDVSSITLLLAQLIEEKVTIYTHSLDIANCLSNNNKVTYYLLGGKFFPKNRFFYSLAESDVLENVHFEAVFLGAAGLKKGNVRFENEEDARLKKHALKHAETKILLAEQIKFERSSTYLMGEVADFDYFITDKMPDEKDLTFFDQQVEIII